MYLHEPRKMLWPLTTTNYGNQAAARPISTQAPLGLFQHRAVRPNAAFVKLTFVNENCFMDQYKHASTCAAAAAGCLPNAT